MTSFFSPFLAWFTRQPLSTQLLSTSLWSFVCGLLVASFVLWLFLQKQKKVALAGQAALAAYEKQVLEERIAAGILVRDTMRQQYEQLADEKKKQADVISTRVVLCPVESLKRLR